MAVSYPFMRLYADAKKGRTCERMAERKARTFHGEPITELDSPVRIFSLDEAKVHFYACDDLISTSNKPDANRESLFALHLISCE